MPFYRTLLPYYRLPYRITVVRVDASWGAVLTLQYLQCFDASALLHTLFTSVPARHSRMHYLSCWLLRWPGSGCTSHPVSVVRVTKWGFSGRAAALAAACLWELLDHVAVGEATLLVHRRGRAGAGVQSKAPWDNPEPATSMALVWAV